MDLNLMLPQTVTIRNNKDKTGLRSRGPKGNIIPWGAWAIPRCPPSRASGHCQWEEQPATPAMAWWLSHSLLLLVPVRKVQKHIYTRGGGMQTLDLPFSQTVFTPIHTQFLQPPGWTSSLQTVRPKRHQKTFWTLSWGRSPRWPHRSWPEAAKIPLHNHKHTNPGGRREPKEGGVRPSWLSKENLQPHSPQDSRLSFSSHSKRKPNLKQTNQQTVPRSHLIPDSHFPAGFPVLHK